MLCRPTAPMSKLGLGKSHSRWAAISTGPGQNRSVRVKLRSLIWGRSNAAWGCYGKRCRSEAGNRADLLRALPFEWIGHRGVQALDRASSHSVRARREHGTVPSRTDQPTHPFSGGRFHINTQG